MKKMTLFLLLITLSFGKVFAQENDFAPISLDEKTNEVYLSVGTSSLAGLFSGLFVSIFKGIAETANPDGNENKSNDAAAFSIAAGYNHFFWNRLGVGGFINYENSFGLNLLAFQAKITGQYGFTHVKFYHSVSGGVLVAGEGGAAPMFDVTLLGIKADFENFNIFIEGSLPSTGILKLGASYKF